MSDDMPCIEQTPGVVGGTVRIAGTRIPVWALIQYHRLGASEAELSEAYPTLQAEDLANAWTYYRAHRDEVDQQIAENEAD